VAKVSGKSRAKDVLHELAGSDRFNAVVDLAARRGFFHPSAAIYGGLAGFYDYGPAGAAMKRKLENLWVDYWTRREGFFLIDTPTIGPEPVFRASGHLEKFSDPLVECKTCGTVSRADQVEDGGRAIAIEEGVSALVFTYAKNHSFLEGIRTLDWGILRTVHEMTAHLEVGQRSLKRWEQAILEGYRVWREVVRNSGGLIECDLQLKSIHYAAETA